MKKMLMMIAAVLCLSTASAKTLKSTFTVNGKCTSCKARIEKASQSVKGVKTANWNVQSHKLVITYDNALTSPLRVQQAIAKVGHDAGKIKATDESYNKLPACCRYRDK